jgi:hypothetical protein
MATSVWDSVLSEFGQLALQEQQQRATAQGRPVKAAWAVLVEAKIKKVFEKTGVPLIVYASACTAPAGKAPPQLLQIDASDKIAFHSMLEAVEGPKLDVLVHSPGGFPDATETIVEEIRRKFGYVRFIVPSYAKSAATMMVMSGDEILIDEDGELGPTDPQMLIGGGVTPAEAIKEQFQKAHAEIQDDPKKVQVWFPILQALGPGTLVLCDNAIQQSKALVTEWLTKYMFRAVPDRVDKAKLVAEYLGTRQNFGSHGRRVKLEHLRPLELNVKNLREDADLYRRVWELYCALDIVLANTLIYKVFYNSAGVGMLRQQAVQPNMGIQLLMQQQPGQPGIPPIPGPAPAQPQPPNRAERRRIEKGR